MYILSSETVLIVMCQCNSIIGIVCKCRPLENQPTHNAGTFGVKSFNPSWFDSRPPHDETRKRVEKNVKKRLFF